MYASYQYLLEHGVVGGTMISGFEQGQLIGQLLVTIINGDASQLPMFTHSAGKEMFNHQALLRWGGLTVPDDVVVMNKPQSWFERYNKELRAMTIAVVIMAAIIVFLSLIIRRLHKSEQKLQQSRALFEGGV